MFLDAKKVPEIGRLFEVENWDACKKLEGAEVSLSMALFLALTHRSALDSKNLALAQAIQNLNLPSVRSGIDCLGNSGVQVSREPFGAPKFDLYRISSKADLLSHEWSLFYDRFRRSAAHGKRSDMFRAVGGVLGEMGDNVVWHAFESEHKSCPAVAGFHVEDGIAAFCVADLGQGYLKSLKRNPIWAGLQRDEEALDAVVCKHATSRVEEKFGGGFNDLFNSLVEFNGCVFLRSGGAFFQLENTFEAKQRTARISHHVTGSSVTVIISTRHKPVEIPLNLS
jgi:hypothetical protein